MSPILASLTALNAEVATLSAKLGCGVNVEQMQVTDRRGQISLAAPSNRSPNGTCRLIRAADGWIAVNLARREDRELIPAWLCSDTTDDLWTAIADAVRGRSCEEWLKGARLLALPVARAGEIVSDGTVAPLLAMGAAVERHSIRPMKVLDLSALWAGPLCGAVFAEMGASVIKAEIVSRPDSTRIFMPEFFRRLNGRKTDLRLDFSKARDQTRLHDEILESDVVITSSRPRAFASWGLSPETVFAANPNLVWVAITGYGWTGDDALRVAFGDDAAAAGGLLHWSQEGLPEFLGDALADPVTGMVAAAAALRSILAGGGVLIDAALARCAAEAAAICRCQNHA